MCALAATDLQSSKVDTETQLCLDALKSGKISCQSALSAIDKNWTACGEISKKLDAWLERFHILLNSVETEIWDAVSQWSEEYDDGSQIGRCQESLVHVHQFHEGFLEALHYAALMMSELDDLHGRSEKLNACWPCVRIGICRARDAGQPYAASSLVWTLQEALSWKDEVGPLLLQAHVIYRHVQDRIEIQETERRQQAQWKIMTQSVRKTLSPAVGIRVEATLWLHGRLNQSGAVDEACDCLRRNLLVIQKLELSLANCAGAVMRSISDYSLVQQAVQKLSEWKEILQAAAEQVTHTTSELSSADPSSSSEDLVQLAAVALRSVMNTIDDVHELLKTCPVVEVEEDKFALKKDVAVLLQWIRNVLGKKA